jgi:hypothetical protein
MGEDILVSSYSESGQRHAMLADNGTTGWLYLHAPSADPKRTGPVDAAGFAYNRIDPIELQDVQRYRPEPPPIAKGFASENAICGEPNAHNWRLVWSRDGQTVVLMRDEQAWCLITPDNPRGYSRAIRAEGPWGSPWSDDVYGRNEWSD